MECGAGVVVIHPGRVHPDVWVDQSEELLALEGDILQRLGDRAQSLGVTIAIENMSPNRRFIAGAETSYALDLDALAGQIARINHPSIVACLDISHAQQGALLRGYDLIKQAREIAPYVGHIHLSDSTGVPATIQWSHEGELSFFGIGDMHAPPGFGSINFKQLGNVLDVCGRTAMVIELKESHFRHSRDAAITFAREFADRINSLGKTTAITGKC